MGVRTISASLGTLGLAVITTAALLSATPAPTPPAAAPDDPFAASVATALLADCSSIAGKGREYARIHSIDLCGADITPDDQPLRTEAVGGEECGSVTLTMESRGGGLAAIDWRATSTTGPIERIDIDVWYSSRNGGAMHRFSDATPTLHASGGAVELLDTGVAGATVSGTVQTFTATCRIAPSAVRIHVR
ncbi:hypothetical protein M3667_11145 [Microbacterium sp. P26]|uniref:hypothetical protein n=1 Tax=Microbacterium TaxID=33882 RepID=UPI00204248EC|nr:hypothetical protein [Microbacterium sp. P26]MCM3502428.1 hypothetical protein [Microbacterium sp. P26]